MNGLRSRVPRPNALQVWNVTVDPTTLHVPACVVATVNFAVNHQVFAERMKLRVNGTRCGNEPFFVIFTFDTACGRSRPAKFGGSVSRDEVFAYVFRFNYDSCFEKSDREFVERIENRIE